MHDTPCKDCQIIYRHEPRPGTLYVAPFLSHTLNALLRWSDAAGAGAVETVPGVLALPVPDGDIDALLHRLAARLSRAEQTVCKTTFVPDGEPFGPAHLLRTEPLATMLACADGRWVADLIDRDAFLFHYQPIVHAVRPTEVFAHECLLRGQGDDGSLIYPDRLFAAARAAELLFHLDRAARINAIRQAVGHGETGSLFINFNPTTIYDPTFCLRTTFAEVRRLDLDPARIVFEVIESDHIEDVDHLLRIVDEYRRNGFRVALDDLGAGYASLNLLSRLRPDFVKLDREFAHEIDRDPYRQIVVRKLFEMARDLGVATIAEGIERREEWEWLREAGVDYVQGYLFARPAAPPPRPAAM